MTWVATGVLLLMPNGANLSRLHPSLSILSTVVLYNSECLLIFFISLLFFIKIWVLYLSYSLYKKRMVGAMNISYFLISFSIKDCSYVRINSILKVMCIFSRRELFIIPSVQKPAARTEQSYVQDLCGCLSTLVSLQSIV